MRKIKFRAWDKKHMAYQGTPDLETLHSFMFHYGDKILMQYTGLTDKNGVEIFEGDIVKIKFYYQDNFVVEYMGNAFELIDGKDGYIGNFDEWELSEVIGNIHENMDLLNEN